MSDARSTDDMLLEYLYGELDAGERAAVEARLQEDAGLRSQFERLKQAQTHYREARDIPEPPPLAASAILARAKEAPAEKAPWWKAFSNPVLTYATVFVLVGVGAFVGLRQERDAERWDTARSAPESKTAVMQDKGDAYLDRSPAGRREERFESRDAVRESRHRAAEMDEGEDMSAVEDMTAGPESPAPTPSRAGDDTLAGNDLEADTEGGAKLQLGARVDKPAWLKPAEEPAEASSDADGAGLLRDAAAKKSAPTSEEHIAARRAPAPAAAPPPSTSDQAGGYAGKAEQEAEPVSRKIVETFRAGRTEESAGRYATAIAHYTRVIEQTPAGSPLRARALYRKGQCYEQRNDYVQASKQYEQLRTEFPAQQLVTESHFAEIQKQRFIQRKALDAAE